MEEIILSAVFGKLAGEVFESFSENTFRTVCLSKSNFSVGFTGFSMRTAVYYGYYRLTKY